jgi:hypothetical protein
VEIGRIVAAGAPHGRQGGGTPGGLPGRLVSACIGRCGGSFGVADAGFREFQIAAGGGAEEEDAFEGEGTQDAALEVGEDHREAAGAEAGGDRGKTGRCGAVPDSVGEVAAVAQQDTDDAQQTGDALREGGLLGGGVVDGVGLLTGHGSIFN